MIFQDLKLCFTEVELKEVAASVASTMKCQSSVAETLGLYG